MKLSPFSLLVLSLCVLSVCSPLSWAADFNGNDICEAVDEDERIDTEVLLKINLEARNLGEVVAELAAGERHKIKRAVRYSLVQYPSQVSSIVSESMKRGAETGDIAVQCDCDMPDQVVPDLVGSAIAHGADSQSMVTRCMGAMRAGSAYLVVEAALANATPEEIEKVLAAALRSSHFNSPAGRDQLVNLLINGNHMLRGQEAANCGTDCQYPAALTLVNYLTEQVSVEPVPPGQAPVNQDLADYINRGDGPDHDDDDEPPLSND